jgi:serine/threonine-protein kinase
LDGAIAAYRKAILLKSNDAGPHCNLGLALRSQGKLEESLAELRRGHDLASKMPNVPYPTAQWVKEAELLLAANAKLDKVLKGEVQTVDATEALALAHLCQLPCKLLNAAAVRFYGEAFAAEPKLAADLEMHHRYNAACAAALAGCGQGKDADQTDDKQRARLRRQALDWLQADLAAYRQALKTQPDKAGPTVIAAMEHWQQDTDFAGVRGPEALSRLPEAERQTWSQLWSDVTALLAEAQEKQQTKEQKK